MTSKGISRGIQIVSCDVPSGLTYFVNIALELEILAMTYPSRLSDFWRIRERSASPNSLLGLRFAKWMPALTTERHPPKKDQPHLCWGHHWPESDSGKFLYVIRDPRDSINSMFKRETRTETLTQYLSNPLPPFGATWAENWALHNQLWSVIGTETGMHVLRFEDGKLEPERTTRGMLEFLDIERSPAEIDRAISNSDARIAKEHHDTLFEQYGVEDPKVVVIRRGKEFEWQENQDAIWHYLTFGFASKVAASHGFTQSESPPTAAPKMVEHLAVKLADRWFERLYRKNEPPKQIAEAMRSQLALCCQTSWYAPPVLAQLLELSGYDPDFIDALEASNEALSKMHPAYYRTSDSAVAPSIVERLAKSLEASCNSPQQEVRTIAHQIGAARIAAKLGDHRSRSSKTRGFSVTIWALANRVFGYHRIYLSRRAFYCALAGKLDTVLKVLDVASPRLARWIGATVLSVRARHN